MYVGFCPSGAGLAISSWRPVRRTSGSP